MKKQHLLFIVLLFVNYSYLQQVVPLFFENFEGGVLPPGWTTFKANTSNGWLIGTSTALSSSSFLIPNVTGFLAVSNDDACGSSCNGTRDYLTTPPVTVTSVEGVFLRFKTYFTGRFSQQAKIQISNNGTSGPFRLLTSLTSSTTWSEFTLDLTNEISPNRNFAIRFWADDASAWASGWAIDDVMIGVYDYTGVQPNCTFLVYPPSGGNTTYLPQTLSFGDPDNYPGFPLGFYINFGTNNPPTNIRNLLDIRKNSSFSTPSLAPNTQYYWQVVPYGLGLVASGCPVWSFSTILSSPPIRTVPYFENFESGPGDWSAGGTSSSWAFGNVAKTVISGPYSGYNAWTTGGLANTTYNVRETSYLQSPPFDFSSVQTELFINMKLWWNTENTFDGALFQASPNAYNWTTVGTYNDGFENWYDTDSVSTLPPPQDGWCGDGPGEWVNVVHSLPGLAGSPVTYFRFLFTSDGSVQRDGIAVDDIRIGTRPTSPPLCALPEYPPNGDTHVAERLNLEWFANPNENPFYPVGYYVSIGTNPAATNIVDNQDIGLLKSFTVSLEPSTTYFWKVVPYGYAGIPAVNCPTWSFTVISPRTTFPYFQDFEDGEGGWAPLGTRSSWAFGTPAKSVINGTASGINCWITGGLTANYPNLENSYVESPLFDFRNYSVDPLFTAKIWWHTERSFDGAALQILLPGQNWTTVGTEADPNNWYNIADIYSNPGGLDSPGWSGRDTDGSNGWVLASHILTGAGGNFFRIRFAFSSDGSIVYNGFAFDDVQIKFPEDLVPGCSSLVYPPHQTTNLNPPFNLQWTGDSSVPGLPVGYTLLFGPTNPPTTAYELGPVPSYTVLNVLQHSTTYYWKVVPYGYLNNTRNENCATWQFTTAAVVPSTSQTSVPTSSTFASSSTVSSQQPTQQSASSTIPSSSSETSNPITPPIQSESTGGSSSNGKIVAAIVVPIVIVAIIAVAVLVVVYFRLSKKKKESLAKMDTIEKELNEQEAKREANV